MLTANDSVLAEILKPKDGLVMQLSIGIDQEREELMVMTLNEERPQGLCALSRCP